MPSDSTFLSIDACFVILTRVLGFEVSGSPQRTPVRSVLPTHNAHRSDQPSVVATRASVISLGFAAQPRNPVILW
jgi:hypothetical protein